MTAESHIQLPDLNSGHATLSLDFGGSRVKSAVLDGDGTQLGTYIVEFMDYPFTPDSLIRVVARHAATHNVAFERITIGMPGIVRRGIVIHTPHYIRSGGPGGEIDPYLSEQWDGADIQHMVENSTQCPTIVVNDAIVAAAAVISGRGSELVLTLGTGLGVAFAIEGTLTEHIEVSHAPSPIGGTFDDVAGAINYPHTNPQQWSHNIVRIIEALWPVYRWDQLYIGGGNAFKLTADVRDHLSSLGTIFLDYEAGARGGAAAWNYVPYQLRTAD
ncbi:ROK family protein [Arcanobacterium buesumense]|uniref:ROK family protein n=1 Tax=Arcanobacterium buesumense TaxID=2722751 RepID=A0A6H2EMH7_9ACTO|nr:ROK family protein [Arcanobacterium buesumense]QJC22271.1 ROK family protein [Arcanobacterium buesumense]